MQPVKLAARVVRSEADFRACIEEIDACVRQAVADGMTETDLVRAVQMWIGDVVGRDQANTPYANDMYQVLQYTYGPDRLYWLEHGGHAE